MEKRVIIILAAFFFVFYAISFVSSEVFFTRQPKQIYNFGDTLEVSLRTDGAEGWINIDLVCGNSSKMAYFHYLQEGDSSVYVLIPITELYLRGMIGNCYLSSMFNSENKESLKFDISNELSSDITFNKKVFSPNETVFFTGSSKKPNQASVMGLAEITFIDNEIEMIAPVIEGKFSGNLTLPENIPAGNYTFKIFVYEKSKDLQISNFGLSNFSIQILQKPTSLIINVPNAIHPNNDLEFKALLYDQAGYTINNVPVAFTLTDSNENQILNILHNTDESNYYKVKKNAPFGNWKLKAESEGLSSDIYSIYVEINKEAEFILINNSLLIRNVGNVPYDKNVEIKIGNYSEVKAVNLSLGKSVEFELYAPDGEYEIEVNDGTINLGGSAKLTGNAIGIKDLSRGKLGFINKHIFSWVFIIAVLGLFIFISARKIINRKMVLKSSSYLKKSVIAPEVEGGVVKVLPETSEKSASISYGESKAEHSLVIKGEKQAASILSLKIKNLEEIKNSKSNAKECISELLSMIHEARGKAYSSGDYIIGIFAPSITRTFDNGLIAIKCAKLILDKLLEHNRKYVHKISFGVGVEEGKIIAKKEGNKLVFTPLNSGLIITKRISDMAENNILIGENVNKQIKSKIKTIQNPEKFNTLTYSLGEFIDKQENRKFLNKFLERNKK